jgi:predicted ATPase
MNVLIGTHGVGKTTLLNFLQKEFPSIYTSDGFSRPIKKVYNPENQKQLYNPLVEQDILNELTKWRWEQDHNKANCFFGRSIIDAIVYTHYYYNSADKELFTSFLKHKDEVTFFYISIENDIEDDGVRFTNDNDRVQIDNMFRNFISNNIGWDNVTVLKGTLQERAQIVFNKLNLR